MISALLVLAPQLRAADAPITVESLLRKMGDTRWLAVPPAPASGPSSSPATIVRPDWKEGRSSTPSPTAMRAITCAWRGRATGRNGCSPNPRGPAMSRGSGVPTRTASCESTSTGPAPALAAPFPALTNGQIAPFTAPFGHDASRGRNLYFPFPFAKSIKITTTRGKQYFQVSVTSLPAGTSVESFSAEVLKRAAPVLEETRRGLLQPAPHMVRGGGSLAQRHR